VQRCGCFAGEVLAQQRQSAARRRRKTAAVSRVSCAALPPELLARVLSASGETGAIVVAAQLLRRSPHTPPGSGLSDDFWGRWLVARAAQSVDMARKRSCTALARAGTHVVLRKCVFWLCLLGLAKPLEELMAMPSIVVAQLCGSLRVDWGAMLVMAALLGHTDVARLLALPWQRGGPRPYAGPLACDWHAPAAMVKALQDGDYVRACRVVEGSVVGQQPATGACGPAVRSVSALRAADMGGHPRLLALLRSAGMGQCEHHHGCCHRLFAAAASGKTQDSTAADGRRRPR
jgi:hypothetical protein